MNLRELLDEARFRLRLRELQGHDFGLCESDGRLFIDFSAGRRFYLVEISHDEAETLRDMLADHLDEWPDEGDDATAHEPLLCTCEACEADFQQRERIERARGDE